MFGIRVAGYHSKNRPEKYAFSVNVLARFEACKINGFRVWLRRTFFGHLISSLWILVAIGIKNRTCNTLFLSHLRLVTLFHAYPEHIPIMPAPKWGMNPQ